MKLERHFFVAFFLVLLSPWAASAQDSKQREMSSLELKKIETQINQYKQWLDTVGAKGIRYWVRLDSSRRPHRLYVGEGFDKADYKVKEDFVDTFSRFLAGHPEKFMLIDLFDGATGAPIGEFGWGGFKLYPNYKTLTTEQAKGE